MQAWDFGEIYRSSKSPERQRQSCLIYLDDAIVFSHDEVDHIEHLIQVLSILKNADMPLNLKKCSFFTHQIEYLRHVVRSGMIEIDQAVTRWLAGLR